MDLFVSSNIQLTQRHAAVKNAVPSHTVLHIHDTQQKYDGFIKIQAKSSKSIRDCVVWAQWQFLCEPIYAKVFNFI